MKFVSASISEKNTVNGVPGDSTGKEILIQEPYNHKLGWRVFRFPDDTVARAIGDYAIAIADNNHFGYGQSDRNTGYNACKSAGWNPSAVTTNVNLDCSETVRTCIACALKKDVADFNTASEPKVLSSIGFKEITGTGSMQHGDIYVTKTKGHTVILVNDFTAKSNPYTEPTTTLKKGSKGTGVKWLQYELNEEGYRLSIDGDFGTKTYNAVIAFQKAKGLVVDGLVGKNTRAALK